MATLIETTNEADFIQKCYDFCSQRIKHTQKQSSTASFVMGLSGGSTPGPIYTKLAKDGEIDWERMKCFLVDARYIDNENKESTVKLVNDSIIQHLSGEDKSKSFLLPKVQLPLSECVADYERVVVTENHCEKNANLMVYGMGPDGHIASLFPKYFADQQASGNSKAVDTAFSSSQLIMHTTTQQFAIFDRFTITFGFLKQALLQSPCEHVFFMKGKDKKQVWEAMAKEYQQLEEKVGKEALKQVYTSGNWEQHEEFKNLILKYPALPLYLNSKTTVFLMV